MLIKIGNLTQTHEVVRVFGFEPHFFQSTLGGFETGKKRSKPRIEWSRWSRLIYKLCNFVIHTVDMNNRYMFIPPSIVAGLLNPVAPPSSSLLDRIQIATSSTYTDKRFWNCTDIDGLQAP